MKLSLTISLFTVILAGCSSVKPPPEPDRDIRWRTNSEQSVNLINKKIIKDSDVQ